MAIVKRIIFLHLLVTDKSHYLYSYERSLARKTYTLVFLGLWPKADDGAFLRTMVPKC